VGRGIFILALGHPNYSRMALNLAMSLKFSAPDVKITLGYEGESLSHIQGLTGMFDKLIEVDKKYFTSRGNIEYIKAKTGIYDLSPYDETLFLDADMLWLPRKSVNKMFDELKDVDFTIQNRSNIDLAGNDLDRNYSFWCDVNELKEKYGKGLYYQLSSEVIYFKKNKEVKKIFTDAQKLYDNLKIQNLSFAGGIPDELIFSISMIQNKKYPHQTWIPVYWEQAEKRNLSAAPMYDQYYGYSAGGASSSTVMKNFYDNLAKFYANHFGIAHPYKLKDKRTYIPERTNI
jgi:hypothetical protein